MCDTCGCNVTSGNRHLLQPDAKYGRTTEGTLSIDVIKNLMHENDHQANHNRSHLMQHQILAINLMSSPGAGKTRLLESTITQLAGKYRIAVIEGDLETENDAERIRRKGVTAVQISTGSACHLDAHMLHLALHQLDLSQIDILFIENVGNLVCPASFDLGQQHNVLLLSTTEGDDKPAKYPVMFRAADLLLINKIDLLPMLDDFSVTRARQCMRDLATEVPIFSLSAKTTEGMTLWYDWLEMQLNAVRNPQESARQNMSVPG